MSNPKQNSSLSPSLSESPGAVPISDTENGLRAGLHRMKETYYFSHDYNCRSDEKIKRLIRKHGMLGYGVFWVILEDLYQNANAMRLDYDCIAYELRVDEKQVESIINDFDLFVIKDGYFGSLSVQRRLDERIEKSQKARESAFKRWDKDNTNANAMRTQCDSNAIKERKEKENNNNNQKSTFENLQDRLMNMSEVEKRQTLLSITDYYPKAGIAFVNAMLGRFLKYLLAKDDIYETDRHYRSYFVNWLKAEIKKNKETIDKVYQDAVKYERDKA